jgi:hypothetical protein
MQAYAQPTDFSSNLPPLPPIPGASVLAPPGASATPSSIPPKQVSSAQTPPVAEEIPNAIPELSELPTPAAPGAKPAPAPTSTANSVFTPAGETPLALPTPITSATPPPLPLPGIGTTAAQRASLPIGSPSILGATALPMVDVQASHGPAPKTWKTTLAPSIIPPKTNFNYRRQILPDAIYQPAYSRENRHLPIVVTMNDYTSQFLAAVARNDVNGTRALLNAGVNVNVTTSSGETAMGLAQRVGARDTARLLAARGAKG